ncbi:MAG TPA: hypothetical protein PKD73_15530 [Burkholderiaceae bacterium]|jgi:hypothetical protein|nr:hypothetical protein [Burkholderiaceae bacterium]
MTNDFASLDDGAARREVIRHLSFVIAAAQRQGHPSSVIRHQQGTPA